MREANHSRTWLPALAVVAVALVAFAPIAGAQDDPVTVSTEVTGDAIPGGTVTVAATITINDGSTQQSVAWTQGSGAAATLSGADTATVTVALADTATFKDYLFHVLAEPPGGEAGEAEEEFHGGIQNRFEVVGINPLSLEHAGMVTLTLAVTTSSGTHEFDVEVHATLPWKWTNGVRNVGIGIPVVLHGKDQTSYDWAMTPAAGSSAALMDATTQNPYFTPDVAGQYTVTVTDEAASSAVTVSIYAGTWRGVITGQDADGRPVADAACTGCHSGAVAPDAFTPWAQSGHAAIFSNNLDTSTHYGTGCFSCHTVGFDPEVANNGFDDASDYQAFLNAGLINVPGDNWTTVLAQFDEAAQLANIQCENCHGPQNGGAHMQPGEHRVSLSSDMCGYCHGEPPRHARFQQWQISGHGNYGIFEEVSPTSASCVRCHTANGFLAWEEFDFDAASNVTVDWTADEAHPQTCQACHDPHDIGGRTFNDPDDTNVRIMGDTPMTTSGYVATDVGKGALCMTCHTSRRGLHNDQVFNTIYGTSGAARAPHGAAQTDIVMGQNLYFATVGTRGPHGDTANVPNTCVTCHMEVTDPPADLSYQLTGTNHTFKASPTICVDCHGADIAAAIQAPVEASLEELKDGIESALIELISEQTAGGSTIDLDGEATIAGATDISDLEFTETHGQQAITVTLADATVVGPIGVNDVTVVPSGGGEGTAIYNVANPNLVKAGWNYFLIHSDGSLGVHNPTFVMETLEDTIEELETEVEICVPDADTMCLNNDRFKVEVTWMDHQSNTGPGQVASCGTDDSGLMWFFNDSNWEMLVKVLNGCSINQHYWVFFAATTDVQFTMRVTDTMTGQFKTFNNVEYTNALGQPANAVTDTSAFATCP